MRRAHGTDIRTVLFLDAEIAGLGRLLDRMAVFAVEEEQRELPFTPGVFDEGLHKKGPVREDLP